MSRAIRRKLAPVGLRPGEMSGTPRRQQGLVVHGLHAHGCMQCSRRYQDACLDSEHNHLCQLCRTVGLHERPRWEASGDPADCCRTGCREADMDVRQRYRLAGDTRWWRCNTCSRTHPYDPSIPTAPGGLQ